MPVNGQLAVVLAVLAAGAEGTGDRAFTVAIGGDVSLARGIGRSAAGEGWKRVLAPLKKTLSPADARIVNLESAFGACLPGGTVQRPRLCGEAPALAALAKSGITAVTLANNHALDAGEAGLAKTVAALRREKVTVLGVTAVRTGKPTGEALGPITVVTANLSRPAWPPAGKVRIPKPEEVGAAVSAARAQDATRPVLVILHGGREMDPEPSSFEHAYADVVVAAGAAAVVFHGSHTFRPLEIESGVPVHFGLGNLLFDQRDPKAARGRVLVLRFRPGVPAEALEDRCVEAMTGRRCKGRYE